MNAQEYYEKYGRDRCEKLAQKCNTNWEYFKQIKNGHRTPSPRLAKSLQEESKGEITVNDLYSVADVYIPPKKKKN